MKFKETDYENKQASCTIDYMEILRKFSEIHKIHQNSIRNVILNYIGHFDKNEVIISIEEKHAETESKQRSTENYFKENETLIRFSRFILTEYLFSLHVIENSINLNTLNKIICSDFNSMMKIIFQNKISSSHGNISSSPFSFIHEYIEDIYLMINEEFRALHNKLLIDENYIKTELITTISHKIIDFNLLSRIINHKSEKSLDLNFFNNK